MDTFIDRLVAAVRRTKTPALVGLDPRFEQLPSGLTADLDIRRPEHVAEAYRKFCCDVIDVVHPLVPAVKPQMAFFEQLGPAGMQALADTVQYAGQRGLMVILDGKRNDIGSTAAAYAEAYLGGSQSLGLAADALTVSPYLGDDSLTPFVDVAVRSDTGVFVLVKTSNPGGALFQDLESNGCPLYEHVAVHIEGLADDTQSTMGYGAVGAVVGATYPEQLARLRSLMPHSWFLVPGFGAQGGTAQDVAAAFDDRGLGAIVNSSRAIIFAHARNEYQQKYGDRRWQAAVEAATLEMITRLQNDTPAGALVEA